MKKLLLVLVLLATSVQLGPAAHADGPSKLRISVMGGMLHETDSAAFVSFIFTGRGCKRVDVLAEISEGPFPIQETGSFTKAGLPANRVSMQAIGVPEPGNAQVGAWYAKTDQPQDVTGRGLVQCQGLENPGAMREKTKTVTIPPRKPPESKEPDKKSLLNQSEKDNLSSGAKGGAVTTAIACVLAARGVPGMKEMCGGSLVGTAGSASALLADPPDPRFRDLLPARFSPRKFASRGALFRCREVQRSTKGRCASINKAFRTWMRATNEIAWLSLAAGVAGNREGNALSRLNGEERTEVVHLQRTAMLVYTGRIAQVYERRAPTAVRLARLTRSGPFARHFSQADRAKGLRHVRSTHGLPRSVLRRLDRAHLPVKEAFRLATRGLRPRTVPASLSSLFRATAHLPHRASTVLAGSAGDPATSWPADGVVRALAQWWDDQEVADLLTACDDLQLGIDHFTGQLAEWREHPVRADGEYGSVLARVLLEATPQVRRPCSPFRPDSTTYDVAPTVVAPAGGDFFAGATEIDVAPDGTLAVADPDAQVVLRYPPGGGAPVVVGAGVLVTPTNVALAPSGDMFVTDFDAMRIYHFAASGSLLGSWGGQGSAPGQFDRPVGLAVAPDGSVVVGDANNSRLQVFGSDGTLRRVIPSPPAGSPGHLVTPRGLAVGPDGLIAVADRNPATVVLFRLSDGAFLGSSAPTEESGLPSPVGLYQPYDVSFDALGRLWVADRGGHRLVQLVGLTTAARMVWAFSHAPTRSLQPTALAFAAGKMFVLDYADQQVLTVPAP